MGGAQQQPFLFQGETYDDAKFPVATFDPKAVTRASYEAKPKKPKPTGPLVSFNIHPDAHLVLEHRSVNYMPMGQRTKKWIRRMRGVQLMLRIFELIASCGLLTLMILINNINELTGWVMRITPGVMMLHCSYAIYHLLRAAGGRSPGSSAAYHTFASILDFTVLALYAYGALSVVRNGALWGTLLSHVTASELLPAIFYTLVGAGGLHVVSLATSLYLGVMFRRIAMMPPDMNPLEDNLTSRTRQHKRNKSSIATTASSSSSTATATADDDGEKRLPSRLGEQQHRLSGLSGVSYYDQDLSRPPSIPFMHTRRGSTDSQHSVPSSPPHSRPVTRDLANRQHQVSPPVPEHGSASPRNSVAAGELQRMSVASASSPSATPPTRLYLARASYTEVPLRETGSSSSSAGPAVPAVAAAATRLSPRLETAGGSSTDGGRPSSGTVISYRASRVELSPEVQVQPRAARFSEAWFASSELPTGRRTPQKQQQQRGSHASSSTRTRSSAGSSVGSLVAEKRRAYEALSQRYDPDVEADDSDADDDGIYVDENEQSSSYTTTSAAKTRASDGDPGGLGGARNLRPNSLWSSSPRSSNYGTNTSAAAYAKRPHTPYNFSAAARQPSALSEVSLNDRRVSGSISGDIADAYGSKQEWQPRNRDSSIQAESEFYSKPYGGLGMGSPVAVGKSGGSGSGSGSGGRAVSSGNDWDLYDGNGDGRFSRRNVSGKVAEEGLADWMHR